MLTCLSTPLHSTGVQHKATLSYEEEERVARVLQQLADEVLRRRLQLWPFFRDFDRVRRPVSTLLSSPLSSPVPTSTSAHQA